MFIFKPKIYVFLGIFGLFLSITSIMSEFLFQAKPCQLCLITRYLFLMFGIISLFAFKLKKLRIIQIIFSAIVVFFTLYHLGVENHWWAGPSSCTAKLPSLGDELSQNIFEETKVFCDRANWMIFGISSTLWSFLITSFLFWASSLNYLILKTKGRYFDD